MEIYIPKAGMELLMRKNKRIIAFLMSVILFAQSVNVSYAQESNSGITQTKTEEIETEEIETETVENSSVEEIQSETVGVEETETFSGDTECETISSDIDENEQSEAETPETESTKTIEELPENDGTEEEVVEETESEQELTDEEKEALFKNTVSYEVKEEEENTYICVTGLKTADTDEETTNPVELLVIPESINVAAEGETENRVAIKMINANAFKNNADIKKVLCDASLDSIGASAFYGCTAIESVTLNTVTKIEDSVFYNCKKLTTVQAECIEEAGNYVFQNCSALSEFEVATLKKIGNSVFYGCSELTAITLDTLEEMGTDTFRYCDNLESVSLKTIAVLGNYTFYNCKLLKNVTVEKATEIGSYAFYGCSALESVQMSNVISIGNNAFQGCTTLANVSFGEKLTTVGKNAFSNATSLTSISFPESLTTIGTYAFSYCNQLTTVESMGSVTEIPDGCFYYCTSLKTVNAEDIKKIGSKAFSDCTVLNAVDTQQVESVGAEAFYRCAAIVNLDLKNVTSVGNYAFRQCTSLEKVEFGEGLESIGSYTFYGCNKLIEVTSLGSITSIPNSCFYNCELLEKITIPDSVTQVGTYAFYRCATLKELVFSENVTSLGNYSFSGCSSLEKIEIPGKLSSMGSYLFQNCSSLVNVKISSDVTKLYDNLFEGCEGLKTFTYEGTINQIGNNVFSGCKELENASIQAVMENDVTQIGYSAFYGCEKLESVTLPETVSSLGNYVFAECTALKSIEIKSEEISLGNYLFQSCPLEYIKLPENMTEIPTGLFKGSGIVKITLPQKITNIGEYAFYDCTNLQEVELSDSVRRIGKYAFANCTSLKTINIPKQLNRIDKYIFAGDTQLSDIKFDKTMTKLPAYLFYGSSFAEIEIPETIEKIDTQAFYGNYELSRVVVRNVYTEYLADDIFSSNSKVTLYGYKNSTTQKYAYKNNLSFNYFTNIDVEEIRLNNIQSTMLIGDELKLEVNYIPDYSTENREVTFTSSDETVVTVDKSGCVKALSLGKATITATTVKGLSAVCCVEVIMPEKPDNICAITNIQQTLGEISLVGYDKWSFDSPESEMIAQNVRPEQSFEASYTKDNGDIIKDVLNVAITEVKGISIEGDEKVSLEGNDSLELKASVEIAGAPLSENRYEVVWSIVGENAIVSNKDSSTLTLVGAKAGKENVTAELYLLDENGIRIEAEENVTYFKVTKEVEIVDKPVVRGMFFTQNGLSEDMLETDSVKGFTYIHMFPDQMVKKFKISATPFYYDLDSKLNFVNEKIKYSSSNKNVATVTTDKSGVATITVKKCGIVQITAQGQESGYSESITLAVIDYMPRLSVDAVSLNIYKEVPSTEIAIYPAYEDYYQCEIDNDSLQVVYRDKKGVVTESEFSIEKSEGNYKYQIGIKEGKEVKKGKKKLYIAAKVKGSAMIGSETYYIPLTISLTQKKPKVEYQQEAINTFYKDSEGSLVVTSPDAEIESVTFIPNTREGKAGLEAKSMEDAANQLTVVPNDVMKAAYTEKFSNKGKLIISFEGYKEAADVTVKNFKLAVDKSKPVITKDFDTAQIYTNMSRSIEIKLYNNQEIVMPSNGYTISWKDEKAANKGQFSFKQNEEDGTLKITSIKDKSGKLDLQIASNEWNDVVTTSVKINVEEEPKVQILTSDVILNKNIGSLQQVPVAVSINGNSNISIENISLVSEKVEDTNMLNNIAVTFDKENARLLLSLADDIELEKDYVGNYKLVTTLKQGAKSAKVSKEIKIKIAVNEAAVSVKASKYIDSVKRESTYVICTPKFQNISGNVEAVSLEGKYKNYFTATYIAGKNGKGKVVIKAKTSEQGKQYALRADISYAFKLKMTLDNGQSLTSNEFELKVKQSKLKVKSDVKNINMYGSLAGKEYGKLIQFAVSNIKEEKINAVQLYNFDDVFSFEYIGDGKGLLYIKDIKKFAARESYNLKFNISTENSLLNATPTVATMKVKNRPVKLSTYDSHKKIFSLNTGNMVYDTDTGAYYAIEKIDKLTGKVNGGYEITDAAYSITDEKNHELIAGTFEVDGEWEISKLAFMFGENKLILSGVLPDGSQITEEYTIYNISEENMGELDQNDDDGDGLLNYLEDYYDSDRNNTDTDGDGLSDYVECLQINTDPCLTDTDNNGIIDFDEDADGDGISNGKEVDLGTMPHDIDTDADTLTDGEEVNKYGTSPVLADTDGDGVNDNIEIEIGTNPLAADTSFDVTVEANGNPEVGAVPDVKVLDLSAEQVETLEISPVTAVDNSLLSATIPGYMGSAYNFEVDGTFESATISFEYSDKLLDDAKSAVPTIYYYNEEEQLLEEVPGQTISNNVVTVPVTHFSTYILLNKTEYQTVWENDVRKPSEIGEGADSIDIAFVIDDSGSMSSNDPKDLRISLTKGFLDELRENDRAAAIGFTSAYTLYSAFTTDKEAVKDSLVARSSGGTNIRNGLNGALLQFEQIKTEDDSKISKIIFLLTDGDDGASNSAYDTYITQANENNIKIFTVGLGAANEDKLQYIAEACGGKYYYATSVSDLEECYEDIEDEVVADITDSNGDGISDYYTEKICNGELTTATGYNPFNGISYETIQKNADFDNDGLKNGEEIVVCSGSYGAYIRMKSDPLRKYSDLDEYDDYEECKVMKTNPMKTERLISKNDVDYLINNANFNADNYRIQYNEKFGTKAGIYLGNFLGINSKTEIARDMLLTYMSDLNEGQSAYAEDEMLLETVYSWFCGAKDNLSLVSGSRGAFNDVTERELLEDTAVLINKGIDDLVDLCGRTGVNSKINQIAQTAATKYNTLASKLPSLEKTVAVADKAGKVLDIVGYVVEAIDIIEGTVSYYTDVAAHMEMLQENIYILDCVIDESDNSFVVAGAKELKSSISSDRELALNTLASFLKNAGATITVEAIKAGVGSIVPYGTVAMIVLDLSDAIFQISDMAEKFVQVYTIAETGYVLANNVGNDFTSRSYITYSGSTKYILKDEEYMRIKNRIRNLASARYLEEKTMKETDESINWWNKWIYHEKWYNEDVINSNLERTKALRTGV